MDEETSTLERIPSSWVDEIGIRHIVVWDESWDGEYKIELVDGRWVLNERPSF